MRRRLDHLLIQELKPGSSHARQLLSLLIVLDLVVGLIFVSSQLPEALPRVRVKGGLRRLYDDDEGERLRLCSAAQQGSSSPRGVSLCRYPCHRISPPLTMNGNRKVYSTATMRETAGRGGYSLLL